MPRLLTIEQSAAIRQAIAGLAGGDRKRAYQREIMRLRRAASPAMAWRIQRAAHKRWVERNPDKARESNLAAQRKWRAKQSANAKGLSV